MGLDIYDRDGMAIDTARWNELLGDDTYRRIARTKLMDAANPTKVWEVSTVWLGLDHGFGGGPPQIFETMVFAEGSSADEDCRRYSTEAQAREGHTATVVTVAAELDDAIVMDAQDD